MPYIPKEHEKYDVLPRKRKNGGEAFDYPSKMLFQIEEIIGHDLTPYGYESYEEYYKEVDACAEPFKDDPAVTKLFASYKAEVMRMNRKEEWLSVSTRETELAKSWDWSQDILIIGLLQQIILYIAE